MQHYFDPETSGFYSDAIHGPRMIAREQTAREKKANKRPELVPNPDTKIPESAVEISADRYEQLMGGQASGKVIVARGGKPVAVDPELDPEEAAAARRRERDRRLANSDWTQLPDSPLLDESRAAWAEYRQQLRDLHMDQEDWPEPPVADPLGDDF